MRTPIKKFIAASAAVTIAAALAGCGSDEPKADRPESKTITLATHDSWNMDKKVLADFTEQTGITVKLQAHGDAGALTNKLVLTKDDPLADGVFGIDNTFATRAIDEGVLAKYTPMVLPGSVKSFALTGDDAGYLTPIDYGDVCINVDDTWFAAKKLAPPKTFDDLADPRYKNLLVVPGATSSSPGLAFLLATIGTYGDDWKDYWSDLLDNGVKIDAGWSDAYEVDFTAGGGKGDRPIVLSYSSSPPFTVPEGGDEPTTSALLDTCFRQVEYAGVLAGAKNPKNMQKFIDFMTTREFQAALPDNMYVYPVDTTTPLPEGWDTWAPTAPKPVVVPASEITEKRADWLREWRDLTTR
ncbi:thiamine ABC transporter substrate-binding protein [Nocardioides marmoriginsengisoli]|uniref:Thiamine ABC transporter substrate-binding protein n=1 Tax=Nocardioides marmoriginsengisoli TaxID=661483 RepID=A0A3N0CFG6_9ACTN|nr:thiamine ABC transporter substrate-binding protein [Nocardioides marmoriginsengisoli]RNL62207.1 thiamine ABC transporter substrate-binding protein [Nocardioides marmoriginsengisoli]